MHPLRVVLILWLAAAMPTVTLAAHVNTDHCQRLQQETTAAVMDHSLHGHTAGSAALAAADTAHRDAAGLMSGCACGCNCFSQNCATGLSSLMGAAPVISDFFDSTAQQRVRFTPGKLASAHLLDLLRPPTLI